MFTGWSIFLIIISMSVSQYLGDLTGKKLQMPSHTGKLVGLIFGIMIMVEHWTGLVI